MMWVYVFHSHISIENCLKVVVVVVSLHKGHLRNAIETGLGALGFGYVRVPQCASARWDHHVTKIIPVLQRGSSSLDV